MNFHQLLIAVTFKMFWCEKIKQGENYCICEAAWLEIRFSDILFYSEIIELFITPEHGSECCIFRIRCGEAMSAISNLRLQFQQLQHVRLRVRGGVLTIIGNIFPNSSVVNRKEREYPALCPFSEVEVFNTTDKFIKERHPSQQHHYDHNVGKIHLKPTIPHSHQMKLS